MGKLRLGQGNGQVRMHRWMRLKHSGPITGPWGTRALSEDRVHGRQLHGRLQHVLATRTTSAPAVWWLHVPTPLGTHGMVPKPNTRVMGTALGLQLRSAAGHWGDLCRDTVSTRLALAASGVQAAGGLTHVEALRCHRHLPRAPGLTQGRGLRRGAPGLWSLTAKELEPEPGPGRLPSHVWRTSGFLDRAEPFVSSQLSARGHEHPQCARSAATRGQNHVSTAMCHPLPCPMLGTSPAPTLFKLCPPDHGLKAAQKRGLAAEAKQDKAPR